MCFLCVFFVWKRGEKLRIHLGKEKDPRKALLFGLEVLEAFYSLGTLYKMVHLGGPPPVKLLKWG